MNEFQPLIDQLRREEIARAGEQTVEQRFLGSLEMADLAFEIGRAGVSAQMPDATSQEREEEWQRRLRLLRRQDDAGRFEEVKLLP